MLIAKRNAQTLIQYTTTYPFRLPESSIVCVYCCESFDEAPEFRKHMDIEHKVVNLRVVFAHIHTGYIKGDITDIRCRICSEAFKELDEAARHLNDVHNRSIDFEYQMGIQPQLRGKTLLCVYCCEDFAEPELYRQHIDTTHQTFNVTTAFAHIGRGSKDYLKVDCINLKCRMCSEPFDNIEEVADHIAKSHNSPQIKKLNLEYKIAMQPYRLINDRWHCFHCDKKLPTLNKLCRHTTSHYQQYTCDICARSYLTNEALKYHIRCSHTGNYVCRKCWQDFPTVEKKRDHVRASKRCWGFGCIHCGERFQSWEYKHKHLVDVHGYEEASYRCPDCDKIFRSRKDFYKHYKLNHTDEGYICSCCGMKFSAKNYLDDHRLGHTGEKSFKCPVCSKSFTRNKSLVQHMWIHSESKRFVCLICNKQFAQKVSFKGHMKAHHPDVPLSC